MFPPLDGPSERKVSIDGSMVFDQPIDKKKPPEESKRKSEIIELIKGRQHKAIAASSVDVRKSSALTNQDQTSAGVHGKLYRLMNISRVADDRNTR